jgi:hypothetical protein
MPVGAVQGACAFLISKQLGNQLNVCLNRNEHN